MARRQKMSLTIVQEGELTAERDPARPSGRLLRQAGMDASYVDLADPTHLEFDYLRWIRIVLRVAGARRVLHLGGGACALARALAAADPAGRQEVCEVSDEVLRLAREHLGLRRMPGLRVRHAEGRAHLASQPDASWDAIVIDAFVGARVPEQLVSVEACVEAARVAPLTLVNVVDDRAGREARAVAAGLSRAYPAVWMLGQPVGNTIVVGAAAPGTADLALVRARAAADPSPARVTEPERLAELVALAAPRHDAGSLARAIHPG
jgi:hypothetical protein